MYRTYETYWYQIKEEDWPSAGQVFICRNGAGSDWVVLIRGDESPYPKRTTLGQFDRLDLAEVFAKAIRHVDPKNLLDAG